MRIYRTHYRRLAGPLTRLLPGALESLAAVHAAGARAIVVTAKLEATARLSLDALGLVAERGLRRRARAGEAAVPPWSTPPSTWGHAGRHGRGGHSRRAAVGVATRSFTGDELRWRTVNVLLSLRDFSGFTSHLPLNTCNV